MYQKILNNNPKCVYIDHHEVLIVKLLCSYYFFYLFFLSFLKRLFFDQDVVWYQ